MSSFTSWSYSRYNDYKQCPLKAKLSHLDKVKVPESKPLARGLALHHAIERYIKGTAETLHEDVTHYRELIHTMRDHHRKKPLMVEEKLSFTENWTLTTWFAADCWLRVKMDLARHRKDDTIIILDWKTGKYREENMEQLELYALAAMLAHPAAQIVEPTLVYIDENRMSEEIAYSRHDIDRLQRAWDARTRQMLSDKDFHPTPNRFCGWCHYRKGEMGLCSH